MNTYKPDLVIAKSHFIKLALFAFLGLLSGGLYPWFRYDWSILQIFLLLMVGSSLVAYLFHQKWAFLKKASITVKSDKILIASDKVNLEILTSDIEEVVSLKNDTILLFQRDNKNLCKYPLIGFDNVKIIKQIE